MPKAKQKDDWLKLAILYDENSNYSPSNYTAIENFISSGANHQIAVDVITFQDIHKLPDYHGLLIRDTTHPSNYTYEFALAAQGRGIKVIDSPEAIHIGCNKIWQVHAFDEKLIDYPTSWVINSNNYTNIATFIEYPTVIKIPDSCFSQGVYLAKDCAQFKRIVEMVFKDKSKTHKIVCQEFIKTDFDWRIGIFEKKILYACKYFMAEKDWKVLKYDRKGGLIEGNHEAVAISKVPTAVIELALKCIDLLDDGLYGIDIKETPDKCYAIEINDNPSIDAGVEDEVEGFKIYDTIIQSFKKTA